MTSPDRPTPDGSKSPSSIGPYYQNADNSAIGAAKNKWMKDGAENVRQNLFTKLLSGFTNVASIVGDGIMAVIEAITGIRGGTLGDLDNWSNQIVDGQLELTDRVDLLSPLEDHGSWFAPGSGELINTGRVPFSQQVGARVDCHLASPGIVVLDDFGLWEIRVRLGFSYTVSPTGHYARWCIRVFKPDGTFFTEQKDYVSDPNEMTREMTTTAMVPDVGYRVEVWITSLIVGRATMGGPDQNRLTVRHLNRQAINPI